MGVSTSPAQFVGKINRAGAALSSNAPAIGKCALAGKMIFLAEAQAARVGPGHSKLAGKVRARYDVKGTRNAVAIVRYTGPAHILNNPTKPHPISPRGRTRRRGSKMALAFPDGGVRSGPVQHPGTAGKRFFQRARPKVAEVTPRIYMREGVTGPMREVLR